MLYPLSYEGWSPAGYRSGHCSGGELVDAHVCNTEPR